MKRRITDKNSYESVSIYGVFLVSCLHLPDNPKNDSNEKGLKELFVDM